MKYKINVGMPTRTEDGVFECKSQISDSETQAVIETICVREDGFTKAIDAAITQTKIKYPGSIL